jgi:hypothetical protein
VCAKRAANRTTDRTCNCKAFKNERVSRVCKTLIRRFDSDPRLQPSHRFHGHYLPVLRCPAIPGRSPTPRMDCAGGGQGGRLRRRVPGFVKRLVHLFPVWCLLCRSRIACPPPAFRLRQCSPSGHAAAVHRRGFRSLRFCGPVEERHSQSELCAPRIAELSL